MLKINAFKLKRFDCMMTKRIKFVTLPSKLDKKQDFYNSKKCEKTITLHFGFMRQRVFEPRKSPEKKFFLKS